MSFALFLFLLLVLTGAIWLADRLWWRKRRAQDEPEPVVVDYARSFFPVILVVFLLRSFLVEPFKIPSGSMLPTLEIGDFILVNKYDYGIRLPIVNVKVFEVGEPKRGDVMVFRFPKDPALDYIKRVVGLPGDVVEYVDKRLIVNGQPVRLEPAGEYEYVGGGLNYIRAKTYWETLDGHRHLTMVQPDMPPVILFQVEGAFPYREHCTYNERGFRCQVPPGHYFLLGDNRDASNDSRYWGFVPDRNIVGRAFLIWMNFGDLKRIGRFIE
ncbi:MAG: signal peptidase I [Thiobacillaceae bacterium]|nr:signal peptidase I [Thiobacillaceae bacterium]MCX7673564.1 signal peptidase I [Thiobacillaceae bacterium]MDW8323412.1 signal peptidase I [Burkholderiales bacterium]